MIGRIAWVLGVVLGVLPVSVQGRVLAEIKDLDVNKLEVRGFILDQNGEVTIEAVAFGVGGWLEDRGLTDAWILSAESRDVVWSLADADSEKRSKHLREYADTIRLSEGRYEVYYSTHWYFGVRGRDVDIDDLGDGIATVLREIFGKAFDHREYRRAVDDFRIVVEGEGEPLGENDVLDHHRRLKKNAVVSLTGLERDHYETLSLALEKPAELQIYAVGELTKRGSYDYAWIVDTATYEKVWKLDYDNSFRAGGATKNRVFKGVVPLPAGRYALFCVTDDSHDTGRWNSPPPYDPYFWGVTIQTVNPEKRKYVKVSSYEHLEQKDVVLEITGLGDDETRSGGFALKAPTTLRIYALGEGSESEMYDYSWIVDAATRSTVWRMTPEETEHAGGAGKNRVVDDVIELERGHYIVYATTDGSHSYENWNASPPRDKRRWGITVMTVGSPRENVTEYNEEKDASVLARIVMVGDGKRLSERFDLDEEGAVRVYAIGEGRRGEMYDYAWIEDVRKGRVVWEMTYRMTEHAGGAKKNRVFNDAIRLEAGEYVVYYESDGSHSFEGWNATPPDDPASWGVTVSLTERRGG